MTDQDHPDSLVSARGARKWRCRRFGHAPVYYFVGGPWMCRRCGQILALTTLGGADHRKTSGAPTDGVAPCIGNGDTNTPENFS